ncbi:TPA: Spy/CpxP family protein refolding chaperone [Candidatus Scatousia excrementigallinarum]|uniref:Spy/CpxP family protein refolding chaperone n=1 Tax=Candidatus Scatousia excrementigallinarum TaxID=2840935 RepID=A0A9D1JML0_9BACT|nr:Spy/CpxP family protein refolding chaperone [Candidatus Scatousia excrementigallinarum]
MKKTLILASLLAFAVSTQCFAAETQPAEVVKPAQSVERPAPPEMHRPPRKPDCKKAEFEKRLKLTDEQKAKAKEIRMKGHEEMKPVMEAIKAKRQEIETVKLSRIAPQMQQEKIDKLKAEIRELKKQAHELRMKNMQEFESILTKKQLKELKKMKEEGRKRFEKEFKKHHGNSMRPPFGPPPADGDRPDFPPPPPAPHNDEAK